MAFHPRRHVRVVTALLLVCGGLAIVPIADVLAQGPTPATALPSTPVTTNFDPRDHTFGFSNGPTLVSKAGVCYAMAYLAADASQGHLQLGRDTTRLGAGARGAALEALGPVNNALGALASGAMGRDDSPSKIIEQMRNTGKPVVLGYQSEAGPHAVVAYGYTPGEGIYIWNPNDPPGVVRRIKLTADGAIAVWHRPDGKVSSESDWGLGPAPSDSIRISILPSPGDSSVQTQLVTGILAFQVALAVSELAALESVSLWLGAALDPSSIQTSDPVVNPTPTATSDFLNAWANLTVHGGHMIDHGYYERAYGAVHTGMGDDWPSLSHDQLDTGYSEDLTLIAHGRAADVIAADIAWLRAAEYHDPDEGFPDFTKSQLDSTASQLQQALDSQSCPSTHTLIHEGMFGLHDHWDSFTDNPAHAVMHAEIDAFHAAYHDAPDPHTGLHAALDVLHDQFHDRFEPFDAAEDAAHTRLHQDLDGTHRDFHAMMAGHSWH